MAKHKVEVKLNGEFTTIDVFLEGIEISLREINDGEHYKLFSEFEITDLLDVHVRLKGWIDMKWSIEIKVDNKKVFNRNGEFDWKGFITFTEQVNMA